MLRTGVAYFGNRTLRHVQSDMEDIARSGFTYVVHCFTENDLFWGVESMREIVKITHDLGMEAHLDPWGVAGVFGGEALSKFTALEPDVHQVLADDSKIGCACLNHPKLLPFLHTWIDAGADIGADLLFFDEPHWYPGDLWYIGEERGDPSRRWSCRCPICLHLYRQRFGAEMPLDFTTEVKLFRQDAVLELTTDLIGYTKAKGLQTSLCLLPKGIEFELVGVPDWDLFGAIPGLDYFGTDPYWRAGGEPVPMEPYVRENARAVRDLCDRFPVKPQFWTQCYKMPSGSELEIAGAIDIILEEGLDDISVWAYRSCEAMSKLWSDDIDRSWEVTTQALFG